MRNLVFLIRAELLKMRGRPTELYLFAAVFAFALVGPWTILALAKLNPDSYLNTALWYLRFPRSLSAVTSTLEAFGVVTASLVAASAVGSEYSADTWKLVVPRAASRAPLVVAKALAATLAVSAAVALGTLLWIGVAKLAVLAGRIDGAAPTTTVEEELVSLAVSAISMLVYGSIAFATAVAARSTLAGAVAGTLAPFALSLLSHRAIGLALPNVHIDNLAARWYDSREYLEQVAVLLPMPVPEAASAAALAAFVLVTAATACALFCRRDIAGS